MIKRDNRLRIQRANNCKAAVRYMECDLLRYHGHFLPDKGDTVHYLDYVDRGEMLYQTGQLDKPEILENEDFGDHNYRKGTNSVEGTHGEMLSIIIRNNCGGDTVGWSGSHEKEDEMKGKDCMVFKTGWPRPYASQVKLLNLSKDKESIVFKRRYVKYNCDDVDRLTLVDIHSKMMYEMNYETIQKIINSVKPIIPQKVTSNGIEIKIADIKSCKGINFHKYQLWE